MGLDMYAYKTKSTIEEPVDFVFPDNHSIIDDNESDAVIHSEDESISIMYWRKHANLQGWMHELYEEKGGQNSNFNCVNLQLTKDELLELKRVIENSELEHTEGFFYGESYWDDEHKKERDQEDLEFITNALEAIEEGYNIYYSAWY